MTEIVINNITQFVENILIQTDNNKTNIFRGQGDSSWPLEASVFRGSYNENKEKSIYETIKKYNFDNFSDQEHYLDYLINMQHYGIPTRLLDWSYNPLVALFFAVSSRLYSEVCP